MDVVNVDQAAYSVPSRFSFVVVSDVLSLPLSFVNCLLAYTRKGGSVLVDFGNSAAHRAHIPVFDQNIQDTHNYAGASRKVFSPLAIPISRIRRLQRPITGPA